VLLDDMNPYNLDLVHNAVDENKIFLSEYKMIASSWNQHPRYNEGNYPFIGFHASHRKIPHFGLRIF